MPYCRPLPSTALNCDRMPGRTLGADRTHVRQVICESPSGTLALKAKMVVLAAGALITPVLLLNSRSGDWPRGLANGSDWVGRNLMRHLIDRIEIWPQLGIRRPE